jgi:hypothetical protein
MLRIHDAAKSEVRTCLAFNSLRLTAEDALPLSYTGIYVRIFNVTPATTL